MQNFEPDPDAGTLPPGTVSRAATERMLEVTGTVPAGQHLDKQTDIRAHAFVQISENEGKPRNKWTHTEVRRLASAEQWAYGQQRGHLDVGTVCAVGNLLLKGMSPTATRKALGITPSTWATWYDKGIGTDTQVQPSIAQTTDTQDDTLPQAPYNVFAFVVDHSQALMELRAVQGWTGHFDRDWRSAQAYLVARNPDEWNPVAKSTIATSTRVDHTVTTRQDTEGLYEVAAILARAGALPRSVASAEVLSVESHVVQEASEDTDEGTAQVDSGPGDQ